MWGLAPRVAAALLLSGALAAAGSAAATPPQSLEAVLTHIDRAAAGIHSLTAEVMSLKYTAVVNDTTAEKGRFYYEKAADGPRVALEMTDPYHRIFLYRDNTGWIYQPKIKQVEKYDLRHDRAAVEQFLLLGMGSGGHALERSFQVELGTPDKGLVHLHLTPHNPSAAGGISSIDLWYSPGLWVAVRQRVNQPSGDYQQLVYSAIKLNRRIDAGRFSTRFSGATIIRPQAP